MTDTDTDPYTPHRALDVPWKATLATVQALVASGKVPNIGAAVVYNTMDGTMLLQAYVDPTRVNEDRALMDLAVAVSRGEIDWEHHPDLEPPAQITKNGIKAVFAGAGTLYDFAITQLLATLAYASLNDAYLATRHTPNSGDVVQRLGGRAISASHN